VGYLIEAKQLERFRDALSSKVTPIAFRRPRRRHLWGLWEMAYLSKAIRKFQPDVFHLQGNGLWESVLLRMVGDLPVINTVHDPVNHIDYQTYLNNIFLRDAVQRARAWVVHSESLKQVLMDRYPVIPDRILVHPLGVHDYYCRFASSNTQREKYILFFGEPRINKGFDILLRAFDSIKDKLDGWNLFVAGKGRTTNAMDISIARLGDRVNYQNRYITDVEVANLFLRAGIVALPYRHGSQSGVLGIAAAFGCPVLATPVGNMSEIMEHGKHVFFVQPENDQAVADGLLSMARDAELRLNLGKNLKELAQSEWSWEKIAKRIVEFYGTVL
jgi:glycosyltransferase involved in cell wall biosynthesis